METRDSVKTLWNTLPGLPHEEQKCLRDLLEREVDFSTESSNCQVIVVEGLDGTGKSTFVEYLSANLPGQVVTDRTPPSSLRPLRDTFDKMGEPVRRAFYRFGNILMAQEMLCSRADFFICDRFWPSTVVYEAAATASRDCSQVPPAESSIYKWPRDLPKPKNVLVLLLVLDENERLRRLEARGETTKEEKKLATDVEFRNFVSLAYSRIEHIVSVDASQTLDAMTKEMIKFI